MLHHDGKLQTRHLRGLGQMVPAPRQVERSQRPNGAQLKSLAPHLYHSWHLASSLSSHLSCCSLTSQLLCRSPCPLEPGFQPGFPGYGPSPLLPHPTQPVPPRAPLTPRWRCCSALPQSHGWRTSPRADPGTHQLCHIPAHIPHPTSPGCHFPGRELPGRCRMYF